MEQRWRFQLLEKHDREEELAMSPGRPQLVSKPRTPISAKLLGTLMWNPVVVVVALEVK